MILTMWVWKKQNYKDSEKIRGLRGLVGKEGWRSAAQKILRQQNYSV